MIKDFCFLCVVSKLFLRKWIDPSINIPFPFSLSLFYFLFFLFFLSKQENWSGMSNFDCTWLWIPLYFIFDPHCTWLLITHIELVVLGYFWNGIGILMQKWTMDQYLMLSPHTYFWIYPCYNILTTFCALISFLR